MLLSRGCSPSQIVGVFRPRISPRRRFFLSLTCRDFYVTVCGSPTEEICVFLCGSTQRSVRCLSSTSRFFPFLLCTTVVYTVPGIYTSRGASTSFPRPRASLPPGVTWTFLPPFRAPRRHAPARQAQKIGPTTRSVPSVHLKNKEVGVPSFREGEPGLAAHRQSGPARRRKRGSAGAG